MKKSPCTYCPSDKKYEACHDNCAEYISWKKEKEKIDKEIKELRRQYRSDNIIAFIFNRKEV